MSEMQRDGSEMRCKRCGANECRIHGFCSVECEHYFDYEEEITDLNARIAELEEAMRWIPVSERLPEVGKVVDVIDMNFIDYFRLDTIRVICRLVCRNVYRRAIGHIRKRKNHNQVD